MIDQYQECYFKLADGLRLYYRDYNRAERSAPAIICLHGVTRNSKDFAELAEHLAPHWRVIVPDIRGRGKTDYDDNWHNYQLSVYAEDCWALADHLQLDRFVLIGTSMGGLIAKVMAAQQLQRLSAVVLNDIGPEISPQGIARIFNYMGDTKADCDLNEAVAKLRAISGPFFPDLDQAGWRKQVLRAYKLLENGHYVVDYDRTGVAKALSEAVFPGDPWEVFSRLGDLPVLVLRGELSDLLTTEIVARMLELKTDLQAVTIPRVGHAPLLDEPESVHSIDQFLQQIDA